MKLRFISIGILLTSLQSQAQVTITSANFQPAAAEIFGMKGGSATVNPGNAGANITWDFTALSGSNNLNYNFQDCNGNGDCAAFNGASYYIGNAGLGSKTFYINDASGLALNGQYANGVTTPYTDAQQVLKFPMTYNTNFSDNFSFSASLSGLTQNTSGVINGVVDGYGTLKTPTGTYTGVLRLKSQTQQTVENIMPSGTVTNTQTIVNYSWFQPSIAHEIMSIITMTVTVPPTSSSVFYYTTTAPKNGAPVAISDINKEMPSFSVYPNPATQSFKVNFDKQKVNAITVRNLLGKTLFSKQISSFGNNEGIVEINSSKWAKGIYLVELNTANRSFVQKIIID